VSNTTIYLIRHCEVQNSDHVIYGRLPGFNLCSRGQYQAEKLHEYFVDKDIHIIISSPLERAVQTAEIISGGRVPITIEREIIEADYKKWEGIRADERDPKDGETLAHVEKRMKKAILSAVSKYQGKNILMVSHADPIIIAKLSFEEQPLKNVNKVELRNASITTLTFGDSNQFIHSSYKTIVESRKDMP
jgi:broad specificity phosphatase PhoE